MVSGLFGLLDACIVLFIWALVLSFVLSLLGAVGVLDRRNHLLNSVIDFLDRFTRPVLTPVRRIVPYFNGIDLSGMLVILVLQYLVRPLLAGLHFGVITGDFSHILL